MAFSFCVGFFGGVGDRGKRVCGLRVGRERSNELGGGVCSRCDMKGGCFSRGYFVVEVVDCIIRMNSKME